MSKLAILCSGQGGQTREMFDLVARARSAEPIFRAAIPHLGSDPREFVRTSPHKNLYTNKSGQVLCATQALAAWTIVEPHLPENVAIAGYSIGELAAWGCAGLFDPAEIFSLAAARAQAMDAVAPPDAGLFALVGPCRAKVAAFLVGRHAEIAIVNGENSFVIGGSRTALEEIALWASKLGAKTARLLDVALPSHTQCMQDASAEFLNTLKQFTVKSLPPGRELLCGLDGSLVRNPHASLARLAAQISQPILWAECLETLAERGVGACLELGPGRALANMASPVIVAQFTRSLDDFQTLHGVKIWLNSLCA